MNKALTFSRFALFLVYFWFGILKVLDLSPASPLVLALLDRTMPFMNPPTFLMLFGLFEAGIGLLFLVRKFENWALFLLAAHMVMVHLPLLLLPALTWSSFLVPTMEGQYIIKNVLIIAIALTLWQNKKNSYEK